jgi:putative sterol carrier protein
MWQSIIPKAPEEISVHEFFTKFVPDQFNQMSSMLNLVDLSFLEGNDFKMQFDVEGKVYSIAFKNRKDIEVTEGPIDKPHFALALSEKDWRDAVTGKFNELADDFTGDAGSFLDAKHYSALMSTTGTVNLNLKKKDGNPFPLRLIFNGEPKPEVTVSLDVQDMLSMMNRSATGPALFMNGKLKFTGDMTLLMKLQNLM